jgi:hypothetical protein
MEGCLYMNEENYYLITNIASYNILAVEFGTFKSCFIEKENFNYKIIDYNSNNVKLLLDNYEEFRDYINYDDFKDFNLINYNNRNYYIKSWLDVFNFAAGRI